MAVYDPNGQRISSDRVGSQGNPRPDDVTLTNSETGEKRDFPAVAAVTMSNELVTELTSNIVVNVLNNVVPNVVNALMAEFERRGLIAAPDIRLEDATDE